MESCSQTFKSHNTSHTSFASDIKHVWNVHDKHVSVRDALQCENTWQAY